jgi:hypothetical protein
VAREIDDECIEQRLGKPFISEKLRDIEQIAGMLAVSVAASMLFASERRS